MCVISPACRLKVALHEATQAFLDVLDNYTLADIATNSMVLSQLLDMRDEEEDNTVVMLVQPQEQ